MELAKQSFLCVRQYFLMARFIYFLSEFLYCQKYMLCKWCEIPKSGDISEEVPEAGSVFVRNRNEVETGRTL